MKLVIEVSEKEGESEPVLEPDSVIFYEPGILRTACEVGPSLIFFGPVHVMFGTEHKHIIVHMKIQSNYLVFYIFILYIFSN